MSSTSCGLFLEENVVSRLVEKSIYMKDQLYDSQTQQTEQALISSATVRTEYTASAFTEDPQLPSATIISTPTEDNLCYNKFLSYYNLLILPSSQTLKSFYQHLQHINYTQIPKISINLAKTETHVYTNYNDLLLSNHIILSPHDQLQYSHLPLKSNLNNISTTNNNFNNNNNTSIEYTSLALKIASININSLLQPNKQLALSEILNNVSFEILGISETHLSTKEGNFLNKHIQNYKSF